jgi:phospholipase/carboxylesterase
MTEIVTLDGPRVAPASGRPARQLVLLLHGYGANGEDLIGLAPHWQGLLPDAAFVAPNAPQPIPGVPMGRQWFSLSHYDPNMLRRDPSQASQTHNEMLLGAQRAARGLNEFIDAELARLRLETDRLALVGFSQGTMMALHIGLRRAPGPACILGYSGALVGADKLADEIAARPAVMLIHGDADDVVPFEALFAATNALAAAGAAVQWHIAHGSGHGIDPEGLALGGGFLEQLLPR